MLAPYVRTYWGRICDAMTAPFTVTPDCFVELMVFAEPPLVRAGGANVRLPRCVVIPLLAEPFKLIMDRPVRCAAIRLYGSSAAFIGAAAAPTSWVPPPPEFVDSTPFVVDALERSAWSEIVETFDRTLLGVFVAARCDADRTAREMANAFLAQPNEAPASTSDVAGRFRRSRRQIERMVRAATKRSPRQLAMLARFQYVRDTLWARPDVELDDLALEAGYADQSHLSREFRRFAGMTPGAFKRDVAFVQDVRGRKRES